MQKTLFVLLFCLGTLSLTAQESKPRLEIGVTPISFSSYNLTSFTPEVNEFFRFSSFGGGFAKLVYENHALRIRGNFISQEVSDSRGGTDLCPSCFTQASGSVNRFEGYVGYLYYMPVKSRFLKNAHYYLGVELGYRHAQFNGNVINGNLDEVTNLEFRTVNNIPNVVGCFGIEIPLYKNLIFAAELSPFRFDLDFFRHQINSPETTRKSDFEASFNTVIGENLFQLSYRF
ncbi:MAG: hypothetical protein ACXITV_04250 [Luteibaculaceae bacterium]